jgi:hypothetical protein
MGCKAVFMFAFACGADTYIRPNRFILRADIAASTTATDFSRSSGAIRNADHIASNT